MSGSGGFDDGGGAISDGLAGIGGAGSSQSRIKNITVNIDRLVEKFEVKTTNLTEGAAKVRDEIVSTLLDALNDVNYAT